ncbi:flagellar basal body P-ring formation chaperone FlgA [Paracoccaceae bacterium]|nr:flagellar basal body P-ring formation chaperone FlgA [Paracoccaceae bacterium]
MISISSKNRLCAVLIFWLIAGAAQAAERISGNEIVAQIIAQAKEQGQDVIPRLAGHKLFYPCKTKLSVAPKFEDWQTINVSCAQPYKWAIAVRADVIMPAIEAKKAKSKTPNNEVAQPQHSYVVYSSPLKRGTVVEVKDLMVQTGFSSKVYGGYRQVSDVIGRRLTKSVSAGSPSLARHLEINYAILKDAIIDVTLTRSGIEIIGKAIALSDGQVGEVITVANLETGVKLKALIKNSSEGKIISKQLH